MSWESNTTTVSSFFKVSILGHMGEYGPYANHDGNGNKNVTKQKFYSGYQSHVPYNDFSHIKN